MACTYTSVYSDGTIVHVHVYRPDSIIVHEEYISCSIEPEQREVRLRTCSATCTVF